MRSGWMVAVVALGLTAGSSQAQSFPGSVRSFPGYGSGATVAVPVEPGQPAPISSPITIIEPVQATPGMARVGAESPGVARLTSNPAPAAAAPAPAPVMSAPIQLMNPAFGPSPLASYPVSSSSSSNEIVGDLSFDVLLWYLKSGASAPPLASTGRLDQAGSTLLAGEESYDYGLTPGFQLSGSAWLNGGKGPGLTASIFYITRQSDTEVFAVDRSSPNAVGRPFIVQETGASGFLAAGLPGFADGSVTVENSIEFWGADVNLALAYHHSDRLGVTLLGGFRYLDLLESLRIDSRSLLLPGSQQPFGGNTVIGPGLIAVRDEFFTRNQFYGGQTGLQVDYVGGRWNIGLSGKVALGTIHQVVDIRGESNALPAGSSTGLIGAGGLLAQPSNGGRYERNTFAVAPEFGVKVGYRFTERLLGTVGYNFLYINDVVRPGDQIDSTVSASQIVTNPLFNATGTRPAPLFQSTDFWAQGVTLGISYQY